jgi:hypothetical protein
MQQTAVKRSALLTDALVVCIVEEQEDVLESDCEVEVQEAAQRLTHAIRQTQRRHNSRPSHFPCCFAALLLFWLLPSCMTGYQWYPGLDLQKILLFTRVFTPFSRAKGLILTTQTPATRDILH